jgi:hypothetical protein
MRFAGVQSRAMVCGIYGNFGVVWNSKPPRTPIRPHKYQLPKEPAKAFQPSFVARLENALAIVLDIGLQRTTRVATLCLQ